MSAINETPSWLIGSNGVNEVEFCRIFTEQRPLKYVKGKFYGFDGDVGDDIISHEISIILTQHITTNIARKVKSLLEALKLYCHSEPIVPKEDEINLINGVLNTDGTWIPKKQFCINRLNVSYDPTIRKGVYYPERFLTFLYELLEPDDVLTLQEYLGYCLIPCTKGQAMMFLIGNGEEGKSRIGKVMKAIWGDSMIEGKFQRIETDKFFRYNLIDKLVLLDDDMQMNALESTGCIKSLVTSEIPMDVEAKGRQSEQAKIYSRILCFGNSSPKALYDKSDGFSRRLLILTVKPKNPNRVNDVNLAEKLIAEKEKIFCWIFDGLQRLISNGFRFTVSERTRRNVQEAVADSCNIIDFLSDSQYITFGENYSASTISLYSGYCDWCGKNLITPLKKETFSSWLKINAEKYRLTFSNHIKNEQGKEVRGYKGLKTSYVSFLM